MKSRIVLLLAVFTLGLFSSCEKDIITEDELQIVENNAIEEFTVTPKDEQNLIESRNYLLNQKEEDTPLSLKLDNGATIDFIITEDKEDVLVVEGQNCENCSALESLEKLTKEELTPLDIYWAFSAPSTPVPPVMLDLYDHEANHSVYKQGWARAELETMSDEDELGFRSGYACNNSNFTAPPSGGFINGSANFTRLDKRPFSYGPFQAYSSSTCYYHACLGGEGSVDERSACQHETRYRYRATYTNIKKWEGRICSRSVENASHTHVREYISECFGTGTMYMGPILSFQRKNIFNEWEVITSGNKYASYEVPGNHIRYYRWRLFTSSNKSYRIAVDDAKRIDQFDFLMDK